MAYYNSYTTRYNETYTAANDNWDDWVSETSGIAKGVAADGEDPEAYYVTADVVFDGTIDGTDSDLIVFDKVIHITSFLDAGNNEIHARLTGNNSTGNHMYFINCVITFDSSIEGTQSSNLRPNFGFIGNNSNGEGGWNRQTVPDSNKNTVSTCNVINTVLTNRGLFLSNISDTIGFFLYLSDCRDSTFNSYVTSIAPPGIYIQPDADVTNLRSTLALVDEIESPWVVQLEGTPRASGGLQFEKVVLYNSGVQNLEVPELVVDRPATVTSDALTRASGGADLDKLKLTCANQRSIWIRSPKLDLKESGSIYWRTFNGSGNNRAVILAASYMPTTYTTAARSSGRSGVTAYLDTNIGFETYGDWRSITRNSSSSTYLYTTNSDGHFVTDTSTDITNRFDPHDGVLPSTDADITLDHFEIPTTFFDKNSNGQAISLTLTADEVTTYAGTITSIPIAVGGDQVHGVELYVNGALVAANNPAFWFVNNNNIGILGGNWPFVTGDTVRFDYTSLTPELVSNTFTFSNTFEVRSLEGVTGSTRSFSDSDVLLTSPDSNGFYITPVVEAFEDLADQFMANFTTVAALNTALTSSSSVDLDEIYAASKVLWRDREYELDDNPADNVDTAGVYDISANTTVRDLSIQSSGVTDYDISTNELRIEANELLASSDDTVQKIKARNIDMNGLPIGANLEGTAADSGQGIHSLQAFDEVPDNAQISSGYSAGYCTLGGTIDLNLLNTDNDIFVFHNVSFEPNTVMTADADVTVVFSGTTTADNLDTTDDNLTIIRRVTITTNLVGTPDPNDNNTTYYITDLNLAHSAFYQSADGSTFTALTADGISFNDDGDSILFSLDLNVEQVGSEIYYAISIDGDANSFGHRSIQGTTSEDITHDLIQIPSNNLRFGDTLTGDNALINGSTLTISTINNATEAFTVVYPVHGQRIEVGENTARLEFRRIETSQSFLNAMARQYVPVDYFTYLSSGVAIVSQTEADRLAISHVSEDFLWDFGTRVFLIEGTDLYNQISTDTPSTLISFVPNEGVSLSEIQSELSDLEVSIKGSGDRNLTEIQNRTKLIPALLTKL